MIWARVSGRDRFVDNVHVCARRLEPRRPERLPLQKPQTSPKQAIIIDRKNT
jgi:hypothetical protein